MSMIVVSLLKIFETSPMLLSHLNTINGNDPDHGWIMEWTCLSMSACISNVDMVENDGSIDEVDCSEVLYLNDTCSEGEL